MSKNQKQMAGSAFPPVLDACCGPRGMWFNKHDPRCLYIDNRREYWRKVHPSGTRSANIDPDEIADFTTLPFPSDTFDHVVFDPPHKKREAYNGGMLVLQYGILAGNWREMLRKGFAECFRVLRPGGTLIFKWCEIEIPVGEILALTPEPPMYGHRSGKRSRTHWIAFLKPNQCILTSRREPIKNVGTMYGRQISQNQYKGKQTITGVD